MKLGKPQAVGVFNNQRVAVGYIDAGFNNRRADENINFALQKLAPNVAQFFLVHFAVRHGDTRFGEQFADFQRTLFNRFHAVVQEIDLPAAPQFFFHCLQQHAHVVFQNISLDRVAVLRGFFNNRHIANAGHCHVERSRNRGCRQR